MGRKRERVRLAPKKELEDEGGSDDNDGLDDSELMQALLEDIGRMTIGMRMDGGGRWRIVRDRGWDE